MEQKRMTWHEALQYMCQYNRDNRITYTSNPEEKYVQMVVVFSADSFDREFSLEERSYVFDSGNKAFFSDLCGYSIFGRDLAMTDFCRLDWYANKEWKVEYCYILEEN